MIHHHSIVNENLPEPFTDKTNNHDVIATSTKHLTFQLTTKYLFFQCIQHYPLPENEIETINNITI